MQEQREKAYKELQIFDDILQRVKIKNKILPELYSSFAEYIEHAHHIVTHKKFPHINRAWSKHNVRSVRSIKGERTTMILCVVLNTLNTGEQFLPARGNKQEEKRGADIYITKSTWKHPRFVMQSKSPPIDLINDKITVYNDMFQYHWWNVDRLGAGHFNKINDKYVLTAFMMDYHTLSKIAGFEPLPEQKYKPTETRILSLSELQNSEKIRFVKHQLIV